MAGKRDKLSRAFAYLIRIGNIFSPITCAPPTAGNISGRLAFNECIAKGVRILLLLISLKDQITRRIRGILYLL
jgi:hypothetical protein